MYPLRARVKIRPFHGRLGALFASVVLGVAGTALVTAPAHAAPVPSAPAASADVWAFAFMHDAEPAAGTVMEPTRQWGSWKAAFPAALATVDHLGTGRYLVRFPHIGVSGGVAHVTAVLGDGPARCQVGAWSPGGGDELVEVLCHDVSGTPANTRFAISFAARTTPAAGNGTFVYAHVDREGELVDSSSPDVEGVFAGRLDVGLYSVVFPGVGVFDERAGNFQVSAVAPGEPRHCAYETIDAFAHAIVANIKCFDAAGAPADTAIAVSHHRERAVFGEVEPPKRFAYDVAGWESFPPGPPPPGFSFNSAGGTNTVGSTGTGRFRLDFGQVGVGETHVQVSAAFTPDPVHCALSDDWSTSGDTVSLDVVCFDADGEPLDSTALVTFSSRI